MEINEFIKKFKVIKNKIDDEAAILILDDFKYLEINNITILDNSDGNIGLLPEKQIIIIHI